MTIVILFTRNEYPVNDELWNFNTIYKMNQGIVLYEEINMITTPGYFYLAQGVMQALGNNLFVYRMFDSLIYAIFLMLLYQLQRSLGIAERNSFFYTLIIFAFLYYSVTGGNYNILALTLVMIGIIVQLKQIKQEAWIQGILIFFILFVKQNIGIYYGIGLILAQWINKENIKDFLKKMMIEALLVLLGVVTYASYLYQNKILDSFISYTILGLGEFASGNSFIDIAGIALNGFIILTCAILILLARKKKLLSKTVWGNIKLLVVFWVPLILIAYPIANYYHITCANVLGYIIFLYTLNEVFLKDMLTNKQKIDQLIMLLIILVFFLNIWKLSKLFYSIRGTEWNHPYFGVIKNEKVEESIHRVEEYIQSMEKEGKQVRIFSDKAALYNLAMQVYDNGYMDLPMVGNYGKEGQKGVIEEIKQWKNTQLLINIEAGIQESEIIREWIQNNLESKGEIEGFFIYETK